jgi:hypothetical protein
MNFMQRTKGKTRSERKILESKLKLSHPINKIIHRLVFCISLQLHAQGKTDQAKSDLARLAKIRAEREEAQAKRKAEAEGSFVIAHLYLPYLQTFCFLLLLWTSTAKVAEIEAKKKTQR